MKGGDTMRQKLVEFRGQRSQQEMAKLYGVTQQAWSGWETGTITPSVIFMKRLEIDSGVPMEDIFFDVFDKKNLLNNGKKS